MKPNLKKKIFLAGHNGMVGSAIHRLLASEKFQDVITRERAELDLGNRNQVESLFREYHPQFVIFCAAKVGGIQANISDPVEFMLENLRIQNTVIPVAAEYKVEKFFFLGSSCIYPRNCHQPMKEDYLMTGPLEPTNESYALAKIMGLKLLAAYKKENKMDSLTLLPCNLYGPGDSFDLEKSHVLSALVKRFCDAKKHRQDQVTLWGTGQARREFMHVSDFARAVLTLMDNLESGDVINVGSGVDITIEKLASLVAKATGYEGEINWDVTKPDGMPRKLLDITKLNNLGFDCQTSLTDGINEMIAQYSTHGAYK